MVIPAAVIALAVFCVVIMGRQGLWMALMYTVWIGLMAVAPVRRFVYARRFVGKEVRLDDEGLTVTQDGRVEFFITWDDVTSVGGGQSILTIRGRRGGLTLIPAVCTGSRDFMLALRRHFHEREMEERLSFADIRGDAVYAGVWMLAVLIAAVSLTVRVVPGLMLFEDSAGRTYWLRFVANALISVAPFAGLVGGLRFSYTWGFYRIGRGLIFPSIAAAITLAWMQATCRGWFAPWELAWRSLLAAVLAAVGAYSGALGGRYKLWSRDHVDRETGAASLPEQEKIRPCRAWALWGLIGLAAVCIVITGAGPSGIAYPIFTQSQPQPPGAGAIAGAIVIALLFIAFAVAFIWFEVHLVGALRHQAMRVSADAFEYWDWRGRRFTLPWHQVASIEALDRRGVLRVHYAADGQPAKLDLSDTIAWHKGLETQVLRLFRERAHLTHEEPVLHGKMTVGKRYAQGDGAEGAS